MSSTPLPTFRDNRDRIVYLLAEYKIPLTLMLMAAGVWAAWVRPELPTPPKSAVAFSVAWFFLAIPSYFFGKRIAAYLYSPPTYTVGIADPGSSSIYAAKRVPIEIWEEKSVTGFPPMEPAQGFDFVVTKWEWYQDIGELEVRGVDPDLEPGAAWETASRVDELYDHHHAVKRAYSQLKGTVQRYATDIHDYTLMQFMAEEEDAKLSPDVSISSIIEEMEEDIGDLPKPPETNDAPQHERRWNLGELDGELLEGMDEPAGELEAGAEQPTAADGGEDV